LTFSLPQGLGLSFELPVSGRLGFIVQRAQSLGSGGFLALRAEPGSGKTSLVPAALADHLQGIVVVTEPRRVAAIGAATFAAKLRGELPSQSIGYIVRGDRKVTKQTRVIYVTEGVALSLLADKSFIAGLAALVIDEFHERHASTDALMLLARRWSESLCRDGGAVAAGRPLFVLMSATFEDEKYSKILEPLQVIDVPGEVHSLQLVYEPIEFLQDPGRASIGAGFGVWAQPRVWESVAAVLLREALLLRSQKGGGVLCFLPGKGEIGRVGSSLQARFSDLFGTENPEIFLEELHGERPLDELVRAVSGAVTAKGGTTIFLATNIAESSLTIKGVRTVVDSGLVRTARHHLASGSVEIGLGKIGQNSAAQRAGRAAREAPGKAIRLYSEADHFRRPPENPPEVCVSDLSRGLLDLVRGLWALVPGPLPETAEQWLAQPWIDAPPAERMEAALSILRMTGCIEASGKATERGLAIGLLPLPVRLGAVAFGARQDLEAGRLTIPIFAACILLCALLGESDVVAESPDSNSNVLETQYHALRRVLSGTSTRETKETVRRVSRVAEVVESIQRGLRTQGWPAGAPETAVLLATAAPALLPIDEMGVLFFRGFFDAFALAESKGSLTHFNGETFDAPCVDKPGGYLVLEGVRIHAKGSSTARKIASRVLPLDLIHVLEGPEEWIAETDVFERAGEGNTLFRVRRVLRYGSLTLQSDVLSVEDPGFSKALKQWLERELSPRALGSDALVSLERRLRVTGDPAAVFLANVLGTPLGVAEKLAAYVCLQKVSSSVSVSIVPEELLDAAGCERWALDSQAIRSALSRMAPDRLRLANGVTVSVEYSASGPVLAGRIQDFFGLRGHPGLGLTSIKPTIRLLAPGGQTAQITADLVAFWETSYPLVKKAYLGRYPRHHWPDDPATAPPLLTKRQVASAKGT
jgi:ATP-dependent helicase HrpB